MFQEVNTAPVTVPASLPSWPRIWWKALVLPSVATYAEIANDPRASSQRAYRWVVSTALVAGLLVGIVQYGGNFGAIFLGPIFAALLSLFWFALVAGISQGIARAAGGTGTYARLAYTTAAYFVPLSLVTSAVGAVAALSLLNIPLWLYGFILNVVVIKAVHQLSWGRAAIASIILAALSAAVSVGRFIVQLALAL